MGEFLSGLTLLFDIILGIVLICIFVGMFIRLGRIEDILHKTAIHQGAIDKPKIPQRDEPIVFTRDKDGKWVEKPQPTIKT